MKIFVNGELFVDLGRVLSLIVSNVGDTSIHWSYSSSRDLTRQGNAIDPKMLATDFLVAGDIYLAGRKIMFKVLSSSGLWGHYLHDVDVSRTAPFISACSHNFVNISFNHVRMVCSKCNTEQEKCK